MKNQSFIPDIIRTPDQKLRVFVSSTLKELSEERVAARKSIEKLQLAPVMFELGARPHQARDLYKAYLDQSHIFIGIYGKQYGWVAPGMKISGLEEEYKLAAKKTKLIYIKKPVKNRDEKLTTMLKNIRDIDGISYKYYKDHKELEKLIAADLSLLLTEAYESFHQKDSGNPAGEKIHNIPAPATSILGREKEIETARKYLQSGEKRLLTFTGPGGSGKTRLSIEVGHKLSSDFPFIHFIELAAIHDPDLTPDAIAHGMGLREAGEKRADRIIKEYIANKSMLLILDNFEQIADDASVLIAELLSSCPELKVLITSRMALRIRGEQEMPILPLDTPDLSNTIDYYTLSDYAAVALFCQRAGDINPDFTIDEENLKSIAEICRSLDGLPLAIELAAARIRLLSPKSMLKKLTPRLHLLTNGAKDLPERQQTMYQTIAWSYNLLDQNEAALFRQLAAFPGGARIDIIESVCYDNKCGFDILSGMEGLVRKSLVYAKETSQGEICFNMLETIREFALDQLKKKNEQSEIFNQHAHYFADLTEHAEPYLISGERNSWLIKLEDEIDNLRAVMDRSISGTVNPEYGIQIAGTLGWFWHLHGYLREGQNRAASLLTLPQASVSNRLRAKLLFPAGGLAWSVGDFESAVKYLQESAEILSQTDDLRGLADVRGLLAGGLAATGFLKQALHLCEDTIKRLNDSDEKWARAFTLLWLGNIIIADKNDIEKAEAMFKEIYKIAFELNDTWLQAESLSHLGMTSGLLKNYGKSAAYFEDSIVLHNSIDDQFGTALCQNIYGDIMARYGKYAKAINLLLASLQTWNKIGNNAGISSCLTLLTLIALIDGNPERAAIIYQSIPHPTRTIGYLFLKIRNDETDDLFINLQKLINNRKVQNKSDKFQDNSTSELIQRIIKKDWP